jgi:hypothetical protein
MFSKFTVPSDIIRASCGFIAAFKVLLTVVMHVISLQPFYKKKLTARYITMEVNYDCFITFKYKIVNYIKLF